MSRPWTTAKMFYVSSIFIEVLNQFNPIGEDMLSKQRYAAWRVGPHHILGGRHIVFFFTNVHRSPRHSHGEH